MINYLLVTVAKILYIQLPPGYKQDGH